MKLSPWQTGTPSSEGVYQIEAVEGGVYFAHWTAGAWGSGNGDASRAKGGVWPYKPNNNPGNMPRWRGVVM